MFVLLQMSRQSSKGKEIVTNVSSSPVAKQTRLSSQSSKDSNRERFKTTFDSQTHSSIFEDVSPIVERVVKFDTLGTTFIPRIFEAKDWAILFRNLDRKSTRLNSSHSSPSRMPSSA